MERDRGLLDESKEQLAWRKSALFFAKEMQHPEVAIPLYRFVQSVSTVNQVEALSVAGRIGDPISLTIFSNTGGIGLPDDPSVSSIHTLRTIYSRFKVSSSEAIRSRIELVNTRGNLKLTFSQRNSWRIDRGRISEPNFTIDYSQTLPKRVNSREELLQEIEDAKPEKPIQHRTPNIGVRMLIKHIQNNIDSLARDTLTRNLSEEVIKMCRQHIEEELKILCEIQGEIPDELERKLGKDHAINSDRIDKLILSIPYDTLLE